MVEIAKKCSTFLKCKSDYETICQLKYALSIIAKMSNEVSCMPLQF